MPTKHSQIGQVFRLDIIQISKNLLEKIRKTSCIIYSGGSVTSCYKIYHFTPTCVLEWDPITETYSSFGAKSRKYWLWYFSIFFIVALIGCGSLTFTLAHASEFNVLSVVFSAALLPIGCYIFLTPAAIIFFLDDILDGYVKIRCLHNELGKI